VALFPEENELNLVAGSPCTPCATPRD